MTFQVVREPRGGPADIFESLAEVQPNATGVNTVLQQLVHDKGLRVLDDVLVRQDSGRFWSAQQWWSDHDLGPTDVDGFSILHGETEPKRWLARDLSARQALAFVTFGTGNDPDASPHLRIVQQGTGRWLQVSEFVAHQNVARLEQVDADVVIAAWLDNQIEINRPADEVGRASDYLAQSSLRLAVNLIEQLGFVVCRDTTAERRGHASA
jgi:hypothetical protein